MMDNKKIITGFLAISELYFKVVEKTEKVITDNEIESIISNVNNSNLTLFYTGEANQPTQYRRR